MNKIHKALYMGCNELTQQIFPANQITNNFI